MSEDLRTLGEFGLIGLLRARFPSPEGGIVGIGDDAAVFSIDGRSVLTTDMLVEGVHFDLAVSSPADVGYKAVAANVSDIAAMGARPLYALLALGAPAETPVVTAESLINGIAEASREFGVAPVGGDTVSAPLLVLSVTLIGSVAGAPVLRSGAKAGDLLCVTGSVGAAAAGLALLRRNDAGARRLLEEFPGLAGAHRRGRARVAEGHVAARESVHAMIDISDGLGADALHIATESDVAVSIKAAALPLADGVPEAARYLGRDAWMFGASGGDDYELLMAVPPSKAEDLARVIRPLTVIGRFVEGSESVLEHPDGSMRPLDGLGWDHFL
ncbi:MAG: thiamine-phosphate kinase [Actinomycetota bacterium]|nr:thiamine-phosphate kinase [Actinomycetota bacterium]